MNENEKLIAHVEEFGGLVHPSDVRAMAKAFTEALEVSAVWYADAHALAIENMVLKDRIDALETIIRQGQSHHFAAGSL